MSIKLSQQLKELDVDQLSNFYHVFYSVLGKNEFAIYSQDTIESAKEFGWKFEFVSSAFTTGEVSEMLPVSITFGFKVSKKFFGTDKWYRKAVLRITRSQTGEWEVCYINEDMDVKAIVFTDSSLADAMAKMLVYLLVNNLIVK